MIEVYLLVASHHIGGGDYNERNEGVIFSVDGYFIGAYDNSFDRTSVLVGKGWSYDHNYFTLSLNAGAVNNYETPITVGGWTPFIAPRVTYNKYTLKPSISILGSAIVFGVSVEL